MTPICRGSIKYLWLECLKRLTKLRMYGSIGGRYRNVSAVINTVLMRKSKNLRYEIPYIVIGNIKLAGPKQKPKDIWKR